jgi:hypothetical protein
VSEENQDDQVESLTLKSATVPGGIAVNSAVSSSAAGFKTEGSGRPFDWLRTALSFVERRLEPDPGGFETIRSDS